MYSRLYKTLIVLFGALLFLLSALYHPTYSALIETTQDIDIKGDTLLFTFQNNSDSTAYNLHYAVYYPDGTKSNSELVKQIPSRNNNVQKYKIPTFKDTSQSSLIYVKGEFYSSLDPYVYKKPHPFLSSVIIKDEKEEPPRFEAAAFDIAIDEDDGELAVELLNNSYEEITLLLDLILPEGIAREESVKKISLAPREQKGIIIKLQNLWREVGDSSNLILEITDENKPQTFFEEFPFSIEKKQKSMGLFAAIYAMCLALFYVMLKYYFRIPLRWLQIFLILFFIIFILTFFPIKYILQDTSTTGGDTFSHYIASKFFHENIFSNLKISGWYPGSYAGFPIFIFYMPLPFFAISVLSILIKFNIAFKLITISGILTLPLGVFYLSKKMSFPKYGSILAASLSLIFLFNESYSIYGGNVLSTLSGEFTHTIAIVLLLIFSGSLYNGIYQQKRFKINAILLTLIGLSHPYPFIIAVFQQAFFLLPVFHSKEELKRNAGYLVKMNILSFLLLSFWSIPMISKLRYTTKALSEFWEIKYHELFPPNYFIFTAISICTAIWAYIKKNKEVLYLFFAIYLSVIFLLVSNKLNLVNIRFMPLIPLLTLIISAYGITALITLLKKKDIIKEVVVFSIISYSLFLVATTTLSAHIWAKWNYSGYENKPYSERFYELTDYLRELPGNERIAWEHSTYQENFGTLRTFETLYDFTGKPTLEGLYIQASQTSPFVYYIQSEISEISTHVLTYNVYSDLKIESGTEHLKQFNVRYFIASSDKVKEVLSRNDQYELLKELFPYSVYEIKTNTNSYIEVLSTPPEFVQGSTWVEDIYSRFVQGDNTVYINSEDQIDFLEDCQQNQQVDLINFTNEHISFSTNKIGCPHLIKSSFFPNWKMSGASKIYQSSPNFMVVYPQSEIIELRYSYNFFEYIGFFLSIGGVVLLWLKKFR